MDGCCRQTPSYCRARHDLRPISPGRVAIFGHMHMRVARLIFFAGTLVHALELRGMRWPAKVRSRRPHASICDASGWPALQAELNELPVFVLANAKGELLQHNAGAGKEPTTIFFADLFRAEAELANANRLYPDLGLDLLPIGLGDAFERAQAGSGTIVPSQNELAAAGLDDASVLPLFGCTKIMQPRRSNPELKAMPLFVSSSDARVAVDAALNASGLVVPDGMSAQGVGLDILCIPLSKACELIVSGQETRFEFFAPTKSVEWVQEYAQRRQDGADAGGGSAAAPAGDDDTRSAEKQAMFENLLDQRQAMLKRTGGVIPGQRVQQPADQRAAEAGGGAEGGAAKE